MSKYLLFIILLFGNYLGYGQYWNLLESYQTDSLYSGRHITDADGNIYYAGYFSDVINIPGFSQFSNYQRATIIIKFNSNGVVQWTKKIANEKHTLPVALSIDIDNHITLMGSFLDTLQIGNHMLISRGGTDIFLVQFDQNGDYLWAKSCGSKYDDLNYTNYPPSKTDLVADLLSKEIFFAANVFLGKTTSNPDTFYYQNSYIASSRKSESLLAKLNATGDVQWIKVAGSWGDDAGGELALNNNHIFWSFNTFSDMCYFDSDSVYSLNVNSISIYCMLDRNGNYIWKKFGGVTQGMGYMSINDIACDEQSNLYLIGTFNSDQMIIDTKVLNLDYESGAVFVAKANKEGVLKWRRKGGYFGSCNGYHIKVMDNNNIYAIGTANDKFTFGTDTIFVTLQLNMFIWMIDSLANENQLMKVITGTPRDVTKSINKDLVFSGSARNTQIILGSLNKYLGGVPGSYIFRLAHGWPTLSEAQLKGCTLIESILHPNPASQQVWVQVPSFHSSTSINVYDMFGRPFYAISSTKLQILFEVSSWPKGNYIVKIKQGEQEVSKTLSVK